MGMDAQMIAGDACGDDLGCDASDLGGHGAAIGITKHDPPRARLIGRLDRGQRIIGVGAVAVKEMLCIKQRLAALRHQMRDGFRDIIRVLVQRNPERCRDVKIMGFTHQADRPRARIHHRRQHIIVLRRHAVALGHTKGRHLRPCGRCRVEKGTIRRVRAGPAALDVIHPKRIKRGRNRDLFRGRELHPLGLLPVAQCGVIQIKAFAGHRLRPFSCSLLRSCTSHDQPPSAPTGGGFAPTLGRGLVCVVIWVIK